VIHNPDERAFKFAVGGIIDYDAIPEDKRDEELGTDDNPLPLIPFQNQSKKSAVTTTKSSRSRKIGRNDPCPCGSGKKYKKCCGRETY
jgi:preprotein translocase subunit SecA